MRQIIILAIMSLCVSKADAQFFKKLKDKVNQSSKDVKTKVKEKAETAPDRIIDHASTKVETKAESKIDNKENKANGKVDKTVDKVDSIKIKKQKAEQVKDSTSGTGYRLKQKILQQKNPVLFSSAAMMNKLYLFCKGRNEQFLKTQNPV